MKDNLNSYTVVELRKLVRDHGGTRIYGINKAQLVSSLRELLEQEAQQSLNSSAVAHADANDDKCAGAESDTSDCAVPIATANSTGSKVCSKDYSTKQRTQAENTQSPQYTHPAITTNSPKDRTEYGSPNRRSVTNRQSRQSFSGILEVNQEGFGFARRNENLKEQSVYVSQSLIRRFHICCNELRKLLTTSLNYTGAIMDGGWLHSEEQEAENLRNSVMGWMGNFDAKDVVLNMSSDFAEFLVRLSRWVRE